MMDRMTRSSARWCALALGAFGAESALAGEALPSPVEVAGTYVADLVMNMRGGEDTEGAWLGRADLTARIDGNAFGIDGATAFLDLMLTHGRDFSGEVVGDAQVVSNVQADNSLRPVEAWLSIPLGRGGASVKAGLVDLNTEFDVQRVGAFFLNSSHGVGPEFSQSGLNGPSIFPATATAVIVTAEQPAWSVRLGLFDAVAGSRADPRRVAFRLPGETGALLIGEVDFKLAPRTNAQVGLWTYTSRFDAIAEFEADGRPRRLRASNGVYGMVESRLAGDEGSDMLEGWVRVGVANDRVNPIAIYLGGGLTYGGEGGRYGASVAHARLGGPARQQRGLDHAETAIELSYEHALGPYLTVQPDLQYIVNPGWFPQRRDALVAAIRFRFALARD